MSWLWKIAEVSRLMKTMNDCIRQALAIRATLLSKVIQRRLRWFGTIERMPIDRITHKPLHTRFKWKWNKGRLSLCWIDRINEDMNHLDWHWGEQWTRQRSEGNEGHSFVPIAAKWLASGVRNWWWIKYLDIHIPARHANKEETQTKRPSEISKQDLDTKPNRISRNRCSKRESIKSEPNL